MLQPRNMIGVSSSIEAETAPSWPLVAASGAAALGVVLAFWLGLKGAGRASKPSRVRR